MTDDLAIRLFVAKGNPAVLWHAIDEAERLPYRLAAAKLQTRPSQRSDEVACMMNSSRST
jgi:hypothetical protein